MQEQTTNLSADHLRVREKGQSGFFGKIFRDSSKSLKQSGVKDRSQIVV